MKLSSKGRYGVRALFDIAFHNDGRPTQIREIAERELIPARFLEQIFQELKRAGIVSSKRGPRGGYRLAKPAAEIKVGDVLRALEGPRLVVMSDDDRAKSRAPRTSSEGVQEDATNAVFRDLAAAVERCFDEITIADVCERGRSLGVRRRARESSSYVI